MSRKILGIDIRASSVTAVLLEAGVKKGALINFARAPMPLQGDDAGRLTAAIGVLSQDLDLSDCTCLVSVPSGRFFYRCVTVPFSDTKKIEQVLPYELESALPFPSEDLLFDFKKLKHKGAEGESRLVTAAAQKSVLSSLLSVLAPFGISPEVLTPGGYPQAYQLSVHAPEEDILFADWDGSDCALHLICSGEIVLMRAFPLPPDEASSEKTLWSHLQTSLAGFESLQEIKLSLSRIYLNGFPPETGTHALSTLAGLPVALSSIPLPEGYESTPPLPEYHGALAGALAMAEGAPVMNFRKGPLAAQSRLHDYKQGLSRTGIIAGTLLLIWLLGGLGETHLLQRRADDLQSRIRTVFRTTFPATAALPDPVLLSEMTNRIEDLKKTAAAAGNSSASVKSVDALLHISGAIPKETDVRFSKLNMAEDGVLISGTTNSYAATDDIKTRLEKVDGFYSVKITSADMDRESGRVRFKLKIETAPEKTL